MSISLQSSEKTEETKVKKDSQHWVEWQRIELLCLCLLNAKQGPSKQVVSDLESMQKQLMEFRKTDWWKRLPVALSNQQLDVLSCVYAPQIIPRVGWLYQDLQIARQTAPTQGLIASILALPDHDLESLRNSLSHLEENGLIVIDKTDPFSNIQPDKLALSKLMGWSNQNYAPPGAYPVSSQANWQQLILPEEQLTMLHEFLYWIKYRNKVVNQWGGGVTGGPVAMFTGPPGTGKTLTASVLANAMGWSLFRVDLASLVSKYIGETEKNIGKLFDATHGRNVFLQFDEVDALMGKRGELKEARDRYANMEVSYLLSRIEEHDGPCILTTNMRSQIDKAFCRRFQMVVEFPRPDLEQRKQLWRLLLPPKAPLCEKLDLDMVAGSCSLTGGQIRNAALHSAYLAAAENNSISLRYVAIAVYRELSKEQAKVNLNQLGELANYLQNNFLQSSKAIRGSLKSNAPQSVRDISSNLRKAK